MYIPNIYDSELSYAIILIYVLYLFCLFDSLSSTADTTKGVTKITFSPAFSGTPKFVYGVIAYGRFFLIFIIFIFL